MSVSRILFIQILALLLAGCRIEIRVPDTGTVASLSGAYSCNSAEQCIVDVNDTHFNEEFVATPAAGQQFIGWMKGQGMLCGGKLSACALDTSLFADHDALMSLLASDETFSLVPVFIPEGNMRRFEAGDRVIFEGTLRIESQGRPDTVSAVTVRMEYLDSGRVHLGYPVLKLRKTVSTSDTAEPLVQESAIWQDDNGALFDFIDESGNEYYSSSNDSPGLLSVPSPLIPSHTVLVDFYSLYGGHTSGPVTQGSRSLLVSGASSVEVAAGAFRAFRVQHDESFEYLFTYGDNKRGTTIDTQRDLWVSQAKGLISSTEVRSEVEDSGALRTRSTLTLEAIRFSY